MTSSANGSSMASDNSSNILSGAREVLNLKSNVSSNTSYHAAERRNENADSGDSVVGEGLPVSFIALGGNDSQNISKFHKVQENHSDESTSTSRGGSVSGSNFSSNSIQGLDSSMTSNARSSTNSSADLVSVIRSAKIGSEQTEALE